jgi:hypothetical protein
MCGRMSIAHVRLTKNKQREKKQRKENREENIGVPGSQQ